MHDSAAFFLSSLEAMRQSFLPFAAPPPDARLPIPCVARLAEAIKWFRHLDKVEFSSAVDRLDAWDLGFCANGLACCQINGHLFFVWGIFQGVLVLKKSLQSSGPHFFMWGIL